MITIKITLEDFKDNYLPHISDEVQLRGFVSELIPMVENYKYLLYKAHYNMRHKNPEECPTWYDGCNCFIDHNDFDYDYYDKLIIRK